MKEITSHENALVKSLRKLARARKRQSEFLIEGRRLVKDAIEAGLEVTSIIVSSDRADTPFDGRASRVPQAKLPASLFRTLSSLETSDGVMAVAVRPRPEVVPKRGVLAVALGVQDPRNLGAIARVSEATGAAGLVVLKGSVDPFSPKVVRGSMGSVFRLPVFELDTLDRLLGFRLVALVPAGGTDYRRFDWTPPVAVLFGSEGKGLGDAPLSASSATVTIPMQGRVDSLNVATAAAVVLYEAHRDQAPRRED